jgi:hypothetical protein
MKKIFLAALFLIALPFAASAQEGVSLGVKGGLNFSNFGGDASDNDLIKSATGFHAGVWAAIKPSDMFGVQFELLYSQQGAVTEESVLGSLEEIETNLNYIQIPVLLKYYPIKMLSLQLGPQFGILTQAENQSGDTEFDVKDAYKSADIGLVGGAALEFGSRFQAGVRYNYGLSNTAEDVEVLLPGGGLTVNSGDLPNRVFQIYLGISLL